jgi:2-methylcitrate dehydratase PrpD
VHDPAIAALRARVTAEGDAGLRDDEAHVAITLSDSKVLETHIEHATGSAANPLTDRGLEAKFRALAETVLPESRISALIDTCWRVDELEDVAELARLSTP